jgi:hypothetical protein
LYAIKNIFAEKNGEKKLTFWHTVQLGNYSYVKRHLNIVFFKEKIATFAEKLVRIAKNSDP